jgi:hydroxymethylglutaryl-CoA reductase (NADPH)
METPSLDGSAPAAPTPAPPLAPQAIRAPDHPRAVPHAKRGDDDYAAEAIARRQAFVTELTGVTLQHVGRYSLDPHTAIGNIENFSGVAQVPIGFAGPLHINGEHAQGDFLIPLATTEGSLVASYNRGIKVLNLSGGVTCTVTASAMQRAPVFVFATAREARAFRDWTQEHLAEIRTAAEATDPFVKLLEIETYLASKFAYLRFVYDTGDAAGQNMVGLATYAACNWIGERVPTIRRLYLESNLATDKKGSHVNILRTRGKRVTAETTIPRAVLLEHLRADPDLIVHHGRVANIGALMAGAHNNGLHSANAITAMFIATGQDVANVAEGSAGLLYSEITPEGAFYISVTIPSLIVATHGGGTGLATQRECLEVLGCRGKGKVHKLAEIVAGVVLAGEVSLAGAIIANEWVSAHEKLGRNDK